jgi:hypothetical protein
MTPVIEEFVFAFFGQASTVPVTYASIFIFLWYKGRKGRR